MPANGDAAAKADKLSGIEEEADLYDAFAPHVDTSQITIITDSPADGSSDDDEVPEDAGDGDKHNDKGDGLSTVSKKRSQSSG
ncbi:hypothetical protein DMENIID0001_097790 [Sergentomyia squamirostris]